VHLEWGAVVKTLNWTFVANLVNFAILLYLMKRFLFKPALAYLDRRREQIASRMEAARQSEERAEQLATQREQELSAAREQARRTLDDARAHAEEIVNASKGTARDEGRPASILRRDRRPWGVARIESRGEPIGSRAAP